MPQTRKRSKWDRAQDRRRPRTPAPTTGWVIGELAQMTQTTVRTLRNYVAAGLLTPLERRGTSTRYARRELLRLLAVQRARIETKLTLAAIKRKLDAFAEEDLEAWLRKGPLPPLAATSVFPRSHRASPSRRMSTRSSAGTLRYRRGNVSSCYRV